MSETTTEATSEAAGETSADTSNQAETATETAEVIEGYDALGEPGKKALDKMKAERDAAVQAAKAANGDPNAAARIKAERAELAATKDALAALQAKIDGREAEYAAQQEAQRVKDEAITVANERILKAEFRLVAKGKLTDPSDVFRFPEIIDLSAFEVGADGEVDPEAIEAAVNTLIAKRPDLAAQGGKKFQGSADGGARNGAAATSIDDQIAAATAAGNHLHAIALKQQRSAQLAEKS